MIDIVERLRTEGRVYTHMEAAAEIVWLRGERDRLAAEVARAHKHALAWMERAASARREGIEPAIEIVERTISPWSIAASEECVAALRELLERGR